MNVLISDTMYGVPTLNTVLELLLVDTIDYVCLKLS